MAVTNSYETKFVICSDDTYVIIVIRKDYLSKICLHKNKYEMDMGLVTQTSQLPIYHIVYRHRSFTMLK